MRHAMVGMPMHDRHVDAETMLMLMGAQTQFHLNGWPMTVQVGFGTHAIHHARNLIFHKFLRSDCTDLIFVDDDIFGDANNLVTIMKHPVDVVSGLYTQKKDPPYFVVNPIEDDNGKPEWFFRDAKTGLIKHCGCGLGFTRISRMAAETLIDELKSRHPESWYFEKCLPGEKLWPIFDIMNMNHEPVAEDIWFFRSWNLIGGTAWADPDIQLFHAGRKVYEGTFAEAMNLGEPQQAA